MQNTLQGAGLWPKQDKINDQQSNDHFSVSIRKELNTKTNIMFFVLLLCFLSVSLPPPPPYDRSENENRKCDDNLVSIVAMHPRSRNGRRITYTWKLAAGLPEGCASAVYILCIHTWDTQCLWVHGLKQRLYVGESSLWATGDSRDVA